MQKAPDVDHQMKIHETIIGTQLLYFDPAAAGYKELEKLTKDIQKNEMRLMKKRHHRLANAKSNGQRKSESP